MGLFSYDPIEVTKDLALEEGRLQEYLQSFLAGYRIKQHVLTRLLHGESIHMHLIALQGALADELTALTQSEHLEHEIINDLRHLSRESSIQRINELAATLLETESKDKYVLHLIGELRELLASEARKVQRISAGDHSDLLVQELIDLLTIEKHVVDKLAIVDDLRPLFRDLYVAERREHDIDRAHPRLSESLRKHLTSITVDADGAVRSTSGSYLSELTATIFNKLESMVMQAVQRGYIHDHPYVDLEYVHSELFARFVNAEVDTDREAGKIVPSARTIDAFIQAFRELYAEQLGVQEPPRAMAVAA